jgi:hypothetical protein
MPSHTNIEVDALRGGEITPRGTVSRIIAEMDGVDVIFSSVDDSSHYEYGETLQVFNAAECGHII